MRRTTAILLGLFLILLVSCENPFASKSSKEKEDSTEQVQDDSADQAQDENDTSDSTDASSDQSSDDSNTQDDTPVVVRVPENFSELAGSSWVYCDTDIFWTMEFSDTSIRYTFEDDNNDRETSVPLPADGDLTVTLNTTSLITYTATFTNENTMVLKDPSDASFTLHRKFAVPVDLGCSLWQRDGAAFFGSNLHGFNRVEFHDSGYTFKISGMIIGIDGNKLTILSYFGDIYSFSYSRSGSIVTLNYSGNSYTLDYQNGFSSDLIGTIWSGSYDGNDYFMEIITGYHLTWNYGRGTRFLYLKEEINDSLILNSVPFTYGGVENYSDITIDLSNTAAGIPCSYNGSEVMTLSKNP